MLNINVMRQLRSCSHLVPVSGHGTRALKWTLFIQATKIVHKQLGKDNNYREFSGKFGVVASTAYEKVNTTDTEEHLFRLVPVIGHSARVLLLELVPVPGHGAQISARGHQQKAMFRLARAPSPNRASFSLRTFSISISRQVEEAQVKFKVKGTPFLALTWHCLRT